MKEEFDGREHWKLSLPVLGACAVKSIVKAHNNKNVDTP